jgi:ubiquinone biosynthesis protein COQ4
MKSNYENILIQKFIPYRSNIDRLNMMMRSAINGLADPENGTHISELGDLSSMNTLRWIKTQMENDPVGRLILEEKPRVDESTINFAKLAGFQPNTLGYNYFQYMNLNKFNPNERPIAKYIPDIELAYICQRYKETHDFYHVLLGYSPSVLHEIAVKWFEAVHLRLPSSSFAGVFGCLRLKPSEMMLLYNRLLPHVINNAEGCNRFLLNVYYEKHLEEDINSFRKELNILPLNEFI